MDPTRSMQPGSRRPAPDPARPARRTDATFRRMAIAGIAIVALGAGAACTAGKPGEAATSTPAPARSVQPASAAPPTQAARTDGIPSVTTQVPDLLLLHRADGSGYDLVEPENGSVAFSIRDGVLANDHQQVYSVEPNGASTQVDIAWTEGGDLVRQIPVTGSWALPRVGMDQALAGLSADGSTLVLVDDSPTAKSAGSTRFAVVSTDGKQKPNIIELAGRFEFDAISPDGRLLYVLEHFAGGDPTHYDVRQVDVRTGRLAEGRVVDKRNIDEVMAGYAVTQMAGPQGWFYTVYRSKDGAFIHALSTSDGVAFCIDLPGGPEDEATAASWGLALEENGSGLYAANARLGLAVDVDLQEFEVRKEGRLAGATPLVVLAKFESATWVGGSAASLGPDGKLLFVAGNRGVIAVRTKDLSTAMLLGTSTRFTDVAVSGSGAVFALTDAGSVFQLDATGGKRSASIASNRYDAISAVLTMP